MEYQPEGAPPPCYSFDAGSSQLLLLGDVEPLPLSLDQLSNVNSLGKFHEKGSLSENEPFLHSEAVKAKGRRVREAVLILVLFYFNRMATL